jgi:hypothetical protein
VRAVFKYPQRREREVLAGFDDGDFAQGRLGAESSDGLVLKLCPHDVWFPAFCAFAVKPVSPARPKGNGYRGRRLRGDAGKLGAKAETPHAD